MNDKAIMESQDLYEVELIAFYADMNNYDTREVYAETLGEAKEWAIKLAHKVTADTGFDWDVSEIRKVPNFHKI